LSVTSEKSEISLDYLICDVSLIFYISSNTVARKEEELMCEKERRTIKGNLVVSCTLQLLLTWQGYKMAVHSKGHA